VHKVSVLQSAPSQRPPWITCGQVSVVLFLEVMPTQRSSLIQLAEYLSKWRSRCGHHTEQYKHCQVVPCSHGVYPRRPRAFCCGLSRIWHSVWAQTSDQACVVLSAQVCTCTTAQRSALSTARSYINTCCTEVCALVWHFGVPHLWLHLWLHHTALMHAAFCNVSMSQWQMQTPLIGSLCASQAATSVGETLMPFAKGNNVGCTQGW
jgi:hypothetical protein